MLWIIISMVIAFVISFILKKKNANDGAEFLILFMIYICSWLVLTVGFAPKTECVKTVTEETSEIVSEKEILNLQDGNETEGFFLLVAGKENEKMYYCYYTQEKEGYKFNKISPEDNDSEIYIKYCKENEKPKIVKSRKYKTNKSILTKKPDFWFSNFYAYVLYHKYDVGDSVKFLEHNSEEENIVTIYVPEGSITNEYQIDME